MIGVNPKLRQCGVGHDVGGDIGARVGKIAGWHPILKIRDDRKFCCSTTLGRERVRREPGGQQQAQG